MVLEPNEEPLDADVPAKLLDEILGEVVARTGLPPSGLEVLDATAVEWSDQRLGCVHLPSPADSTPVDGYRVVIQTDKAQYDYRVDDSGNWYLCGEPVLTEESEGGHEDGDHQKEEESEDATS